METVSVDFLTERRSGRGGWKKKKKSETKYHLAIRVCKDLLPFYAGVPDNRYINNSL